MESRGQQRAHWLRRRRSSADMTKVGLTLPVVFRSSCSSWTTSEEASWSGNLRSMRWKPSRQWPYLSSPQLACLSSPTSSVWSTFWLSVSKEELQSSWRLMLSGSMSWFLAYFFPLPWLSIIQIQFGGARYPEGDLEEPVEDNQRTLHIFNRYQQPWECTSRCKITSQRDGGPS